MLYTIASKKKLEMSKVFLPIIMREAITYPSCLIFYPSVL